MIRLAVKPKGEPHMDEPAPDVIHAEDEAPRQVMVQPVAHPPATRAAVDALDTRMRSLASTFSGFATTPSRLAVVHEDLAELERLVKLARAAARAEIPRPRKPREAKQ